MSTDLNLVPTGGKLTTGTSWRERFGGLGGNARQYGIFAALVVIILLFQAMTGGRLLYPDNVAALVVALVLIYFWCQPGDAGDNAYGPAPVAFDPSSRVSPTP